MPGRDNATVPCRIFRNWWEHEHQLILAKQIAEKAEPETIALNNMSYEIRTLPQCYCGFHQSAG